jgi:hypothetical protein
MGKDAMVTYPTETLDPESDDGTMPANVEALAKSVVGHRIVKAAQEPLKAEDADDFGAMMLVLTLDDGRRVSLANHGECCAYTALASFLLHPESVDHIITGVGTTGEFTEWHIYADFGDVLTLSVDWSCGNPFFYGYGFTIQVCDVSGSKLFTSTNFNLQQKMLGIDRRAREIQEMKDAERR